MKIALAQVKSKKGDVEANIIDHTNWIKLAASTKADLIVFPELSLTQYGPAMAKSLAMELHDKSLDVFQHLSDYHQIIICVGAPLNTHHGITISMLVFQPKHDRGHYDKQFLHKDEEPHFIPGSGSIQSIKRMGLAICYELSVQQHIAGLVHEKIGYYLASVAKTEKGISNASERLSHISKSMGIWSLMVNAVGKADDFECAGGSGVWDKNGACMVQLGDEEQLLIFDSQNRTFETLEM